MENRAPPRSRASLRPWAGCSRIAPAIQFKGILDDCGNPDRLKGLVSALRTTDPERPCDPPEVKLPTAGANHILPCVIVACEHQTSIRRNSEDTAMTSFHGLSGIKAIVTIGAALSMTAGLALAGDNNISSDQILQALQPKPVTRGLSTGPQVDPAVKAKEINFVQTLRNRKTRSLSLGEREQIAEIASGQTEDRSGHFGSTLGQRTSPRHRRIGAGTGKGAAPMSISRVRPSSSPATPVTTIGGEAYNRGLSENAPVRSGTNILSRQVRHRRLSTSSPSDMANDQTKGSGARRWIPSLLRRVEINQHGHQDPHRSKLQPTKPHRDTAGGFKEYFAEVP